MATAEINVKSTKNEILDAYHDALLQIKELKKINKHEVKREQEKQEMIETASQHTAEQIVTDLANLKLSLVKSLEELENQLLSEHKKLTTLQQVIVAQSRDLERTLRN